MSDSALITYVTTDTNAALGSGSFSGYYGPPLNGWVPTVASGAQSGWTVTIPGSTTVPLPAVQVPYGGMIGAGGWQAYPKQAPTYDWEQAEELSKFLKDQIKLSDDELEMLEAVNKWKKFLGI